jgi:hypothetical protein
MIAERKSEMKNNRVLLTGITIVLLLAIVLIVARETLAGQSDLAALRRATAQFHRPEAAQAAGYDLVPGLDHCFDNPGVGGMGIHYINVDLLDLALDPLRPEAMVYVPGPQGQLQLGAVEYIVPAEAWDAENDELPTVLGQHLHLNEALGVYVLHAWVWRNNPAGIFEDWNPNVSCP